MWKQIFSSELVRIGDYRCRAHCSGCGGEELSSTSDIVFLRRGVFVKHVRGREIVADANSTVFFNRGETYRVSHPVDGGDECTTITLREDVLRDAIRVRDPAVDDRPEGPFRDFEAPCPAAAYSRQRRLVEHLRGGRGDVLWVEETVLALLDSLPARGAAPRRRVETRRAHRDTVNEAKVLLARRMRSGISLDEAARAVHCSPFHLARVFRNETGAPLHAYLTRLRLRAALEAMLEQPADLTAVALDTGFFDQSHLTNAFTREFGLSPGRFRDELSHRRRCEMSKNFQA